MAQESLMSDRYLVVARLTQRQLEDFPAKAWVVVEVFNDEAAGRERFHHLRLPLERLKLGAVLIRATTTADFERIVFEKTVISKDADFWELQHAELMRATQHQQDAWAAAIDGAIAEAAAEREAAVKAAAEVRAATVRVRSGLQQRHKAMAAGFAAVLAVGGVVAVARQATGPANSVVAKSRDESMTVIIADPGNPRMLTEYALKPDGTRTVVRRLTKEQVEAGVSPAEPDNTAATPASTPRKSLAEALTGFFSVRD